jgi:hypothetical protein
MNNKKIILYLLSAIIVSFAGIYAFTFSHTHAVSVSSAYASISDSTDTKTYTCPMHPEVISDKPGECPKCGMDLILKEDDGKKDEKKDESMDHSNCKGCMHKH